MLNGAGDFNNSIIAPKQGTTQPTKIANDGDFVFCIRATIGNLSVCEESIVLAGVLPLQEKGIGSISFLHQTISNLFRVWGVGTQLGSVIKGITGPEVRNSPVILPPESIRKSFENTVRQNMLLTQEYVNLE